MRHHDELSRLLIKAIEDARTSAERLAVDAHLGKDTIGRWIRGETIPRLSSLGQLEAYLTRELRQPVDLGDALRERQRAAVAGEDTGIRPERPPDMSLDTYLGRLLAADYVRSGARVGQFGALSDPRSEGFFQQPGSEEPLELKPNYFHTYWGIVGVQTLLTRELNWYRQTTATAIARRFADRDWLRLRLPDYEAAPIQDSSMVGRIRHTARATAILFLCDQHLDVASDLAWLLITDLPRVVVHGGVPEALAPDRGPSIQASAAVLQAIALASAHSGLADGSEFIDRSRRLRSGIESYLFEQWQRNRWAFGDLPWQIHAPVLFPSVAPYASPALRGLIADTLREQIRPSGALRTRAVGIFDAPGPILDLRIANAVAQDPLRRNDSRLRNVVSRLTALRWDDEPLRTADITALAILNREVSSRGDLVVE